MDRRQKILEGLDLHNSVGAEIGALCNPIVTRDEGRVLYVDYTGTDSLKAKYANDLSVDVSKIVEVDAVWGDKSLKEALGDDVVLDYVIASHVVEHVPDLVTWLDEVRSVLKPEGELRLAVPDRRFTFDYVRGETRISDVLTAYLVRARVPQPHEVLDFVLNAKKVDVQKAWSGEVDVAELAAYNTFEDALRLAREVLENGTYHDTHCWVFTPRSFSELCQHLASVGLLHFACETFHDTEHNQLEFFVKLRRCDDREKIIQSWRQMKESVRECDSLEAALRRIRSLENSLSWKLTAPLRFVDRTLRRLTKTSLLHSLFSFPN
jgi:2-polyprenyl-3-methyl-5-hydroxy-6-metoxy-1,4-benzoquinol methylase